MKKIVQKVYWLYKSDKKQTSPYVSTVLTFVGIFFLTFVVILLLLDIPTEYIFPFQTENSILQRWLNGSIYPTFLIIIFVIRYPKSKLEIEQFNNQNLKKIKNWLILFFLIPFILMMLLLIRKGIKKGLIKSHSQASVV